MKICFVASSGGHWEELLCLKPLTEKYDSVFVTEKGGQSDDAEGLRIYTVDQMNRKEKFFVLKFIRLFVKAAIFTYREKPDVFITTGALISFPFCVIGKLFRKKIVYIESFARIEGKSMTGKLVYPIADYFVVQWKSMLEYYPKAHYGGAIF